MRSIILCRNIIRGFNTHTVRASAFTAMSMVPCETLGAWDLKLPGNTVHHNNYFTYIASCSTRPIRKRSTHWIQPSHLFVIWWGWDFCSSQQNQHNKVSTPTFPSTTFRDLSTESQGSSQIHWPPSFVVYFPAHLFSANMIWLVLAIHRHTGFQATWPNDLMELSTPGAEQMVTPSQLGLSCSTPLQSNWTRAALRPFFQISRPHKQLQNCVIAT